MEDEKIKSIVDEIKAAFEEIGSFELSTTVALGAAVGTYRVVAYSPADRSYQAGWSD